MTIFPKFIALLNSEIQKEVSGKFSLDVDVRFLRLPFDFVRLFFFH